MQYAAAAIWLLYMVHSLRESRTLDQLARGGETKPPCWDAVDKGMTPTEVRRALGNPLAIQATGRKILWRYKLGGELGVVKFACGKVVAYNHSPAV